LTYRLLKVPEIVRDLARALLLLTPERGELAVWLLLNGVELERVVDLSSLHQRPGAAKRSEWSYRSLWPMAPSLWSDRPEEAFVVSFLQRILHTSGYRNVQPVLSGVREDVRRDEL
jgi:hypothetical protein